MQDYQKDFLNLCIELGVLRFGEFELKSGRVSPYFFNAGLFNSGRALAALGRYYAQALVEAEIEYDMLFGPAYKGIPLVAVTAAALAEQHDLDVPYAFNRKEEKSHGEGGATIGAALTGKVVIVDDVITAGTAIRGAIDIIRNAGAIPAGVLIALDRQERGQGKLSAIQEIEETFELNVASLVKLTDLLGFLEEAPHRDDDNGAALEALKRYRRRYAVLQ